jgi:hypothetical protein
MIKVLYYSAVLLVGTLLPQASAGEKGIVEGPNDATITVDPVCVERNKTPDIGDAVREQRPVWIDCEFENKHVTLMMAALPRVLSSWNEFQNNKTDDIYEVITAGTDWYQLRDRIWFWGWSSVAFAPPADLNTRAWICPSAKKRCGKPEKILQLKVVGTQAATIALLAIGDFEVVDLKAADGKTVGIKWVFPEPIEKTIATFDFGR